MQNLRMRGNDTMQNSYPFEKMLLPYDYTELVPYCDPDTLYLHHHDLYNSYVDMLNFLLSGYPQYQTWTLERLIFDDLLMPVTQKKQIKNFAGAIYNHNLYFDGMTNGKLSGQPEGKLLEALSDNYGSFEMFKKIFKQAAFNVLGPGWVWLNSGSDGSVHIAITENNKLPSLKSIAPILVTDIWEHAYYLHYPAKLSEYMDSWFSVVDWKKAGQKFNQSIGEKEPS